MTISKWKRFTLLLGCFGAVACFAESAQADQTYTLALTGRAIHNLDCWEDLSLCGPELPPPPPVMFDWTGTATVVVDASGDGTFAGLDFLSLALSANLASFDSIRSGILYPFGLPWSVTVSGGLVTSLDLTHVEYAGTSIVRTTFSGLSVQYDQPALHHYGSTAANATLAPVPEPASYAMMLLGLAGAGFMARRGTQRKPVRA